ncbi:MAG: SDR family oxidoreductase [Candidatus Doudnabacteria bacterium]
MKADVSKPDEVARVVSETKAKFGRIDGLIHMAAIYQKTPWKSLAEADWNKNMDVIAKSAFLMSKAAGDEMTIGEDHSYLRLVSFDPAVQRLFTVQRGKKRH